VKECVDGWIIEKEHQRHRVSRASKVERGNTAAVPNANVEVTKHTKGYHHCSQHVPTEREAEDQGCSKSGLAARNQGGSNRAKSRRRGAANHRQKLRISSRRCAK
jgi:hypothetical protein